MTAIVFLLLTAPSVAPPSSPTSHWAFRTPRVQAPPTVSPTPALRNPLDSFVLARLHAAGLAPAVPPDRRTLLRRLSFDLLGLPPTPEDLDAFERDTRPDAWERVVDRCLASPHFGERWGQHWLDVARFAETNGYEADGERPQSWRFRDWVVGAFNADLPYDRFLTEQLAGDLLPRASHEALIAAGFNRCGPIHQVSGNVDPLELRHELLNEMTAGVGAAFLGLTLTCARCHDHKFDPLSQKDYFRIEAFFSQAQPKQVELASAAERTRHVLALAKWQASLQPLRQQIDALDAPYRKKLRAAKRARLERRYLEALDSDPKTRTKAQQTLIGQAETLLKVTWDEILAALSEDDARRRAELRQQLHVLEAKAPEPPARAWSLEEGKGALAAHVLRRGNPHRRGPSVTPGFPEVFGVAEGGTTRLDLARWLTRKEHPLTARVIANRLWQHHFGAGIVRTPNDFGTRGATPTHPELLDWLAGELVSSGWSLKHLHRLIVTSATYRQSSRAENPQAARIDPDNRLLWRANRRRLEAETLRDAVLAVSGQLTGWVGGGTVRIPLEPEVYDLIFTEGEPDGLWTVTPDRREHTRRTLYLFNKRNVRQPLLEAFDQPDTLSPCPVRPVSTFAPQALILLNGPLTQEQSGAFAGRLRREAGANPGAQIERAYRLALGREPTGAERIAAEQFLRDQTELLRDRLRARQSVALPEEIPPGADLAALAALGDFCLALLNRNAFVFVE